MTRYYVYEFNSPDQANKKLKQVTAKGWRVHSIAAAEARKLWVLVEKPAEGIAPQPGAPPQAHPQAHQQAFPAHDDSPEDPPPDPASPEGEHELDD